MSKQSFKGKSHVHQQNKPLTTALKPWYQDKNTLIYLAVLLVISFLVYIPVLQNEFVEFDDDKLITENELITLGEETSTKDMNFAEKGNCRARQPNMVRVFGCWVNSAARPC